MGKGEIYGEEVRLMLEGLRALSRARRASSGSEDMLDPFLFFLFFLGGWFGFGCSIRWMILRR